MQIALVRKSPQVNIRFCYVSKGVDIHTNVQAQADELSQLLKPIYTGANVTVDFIGTNSLWEMINHVPNNEIPLPLSGNPIDNAESKVFIALVKLKDYFRFIINDKQELIRHIFEANVRDYQGNVTVNKDIQESLETTCEENFWWLNNGTTIIASDAHIALGRTLMITDPEIVNGLQTSTEIFNYFKKYPDRLEIESRELLVRVIVPETEDSRDRIIFATNNQTPIQKSSLRATDVIHRQIELYFMGRGLYYDRRKNYYKNNGIKGNHIISLPYLSQCLISVLLQNPNDARARPSSLLSDDETYNTLYKPEQELSVFYNIAVVGKKVEKVLKGSNDYSTTQVLDIKFYVIYTLFAKATGKDTPTPKDIISVAPESITDDFILSVSNDVFTLFCQLGGTDKVAKGSEFIMALKDSILKS